jgi:hypothetical protein
LFVVKRLLATSSVCQTLQLTTKRYELHKTMFLLDYFSGCLSSLLEFVKQLSLRVVFTKPLTIILRSFLKVKWCFSYKKTSITTNFCDKTRHLYLSDDLKNFVKGFVNSKFQNIPMIILTKRIGHFKDKSDYNRLIELKGSVI